jgi:hypothetical protein
MVIYSVIVYCCYDIVTGTWMIFCIPFLMFVHSNNHRLLLVVEMKLVLALLVHNWVNICIGFTPFSNIYLYIFILILIFFFFYFFFFYFFFLFFYLFYFFIFFIFFFFFLFFFFFFIFFLLLSVIVCNIIYIHIIFNVYISW